jgi:hypothetical protein
LITIRPERPEDADRVRSINELAFGQPTEANLVDRLRQACTTSLSLVAEDDVVVGHILFTPVVVESQGRRVIGTGLAPMAVLPARQASLTRRSWSGSVMRLPWQVFPVWQSTATSSMSSRRLQAQS